MCDSDKSIKVMHVFLLTWFVGHCQTYLGDASISVGVDVGAKRGLAAMPMVFGDNCTVGLAARREYG